MKSSNSKIRNSFNIILICVFAVLTSCFLGSYIIGKSGLKLPDWTNIGITESYFEGRSYQYFLIPSLSNISTGDFQDQTEEWASDHIPFRNQLLVANATLQRNGIRIANSLSRFDCYPTYYGSEQIETADMKHVLFISQAVTSEDIVRMNAFADNLNGLASEYPDINFTVFGVDDNRWSDVNPSAKYVTNACTDALIQQELWNHLDKRITVLANTNLSYDQYFNYFLPTEHHWSFRGWSSAYEQLAEVLGWEAMSEQPIYALEKYPSYGSTARLGLDFDTPKYILEDYDVDFSNLQWETDGESITEPGEREIYRNDSEPQSSFWKYHLYDDYYGSNYIELKITNPNSETLNDAIVITDSQGKPLLSYIAQNYRTIIKLDATNRINPTSLHELIASTNCKDVIFILTPQAISSENMAASNLFN